MEQIISLLKKLALPDLTPGYLRGFHTEVLQAVQDGKLTEEEISKLETRKEELGLTDDALSAVKQELYVAAFNSIQDEKDVTDEEWDELEHIQEYLGLTDQEIAKTKKELYRMRIMSEIRKGNLPVVHTDLLIPDDEELIHWVEPVEIIHIRTPKQDEGHFIVTSKKIIVRGKQKTTSIKLKHVISADCSVGGIVLHAEDKETITLRYRVKGNHNVVGSIVLHAIAQAKK